MFTTNLRLCEYDGAVRLAADEGLFVAEKVDMRELQRKAVK